MFEKEEEILHDTRRQLDNISIPEQIQLDVAIQRGMLKAKKAKRMRKRTLWSISVSAILIISFVTSIRVSPAFANMVSGIPGMERFVEYIRFDKGLKAILENEYYEPIGISQVKDNITVTIDGVIFDETGMEIYYTMEAPYSLKHVDFPKIELLNDGEFVPEGSISYLNPNQEHENRLEDQFRFVFKEPFEYRSNQFELRFQIGNKQYTTFEIPFTVQKELKKGKVYALNKEVMIDGQKILVTDVAVYPLRVAVNIALDEENTMQILNFDDMRIENEKG